MNAGAAGTYLSSMLVLLSPAKDLAKEAPVIKDATRPVLLEHASPLVQKLRTLSAARLAELMDMSPALGELNRQRYAAWCTPFTPRNARPAVFVFNGEAYRGLDARSLGADDLRFGQYHLRILSGLYGVLRPLDLIQDYRLMMGTPFGIGAARDLYAYWRERITDVLARDLEASGSRVILNLASNEYVKAVDVKRLGATVITPEFKDKVGSAHKSLQVYVKHQRGAMARLVLEHRILDPEQLKQHVVNGYCFVASESTSSRWCFLRERRPAAAPGRLSGGRMR